jgi:hypothetical protein
MCIVTFMEIFQFVQILLGVMFISPGIRLEMKYGWVPHHATSVYEGRCGTLLQYICRLQEPVLALTIGFYCS